MKIGLVGAELFHVGGQTDRHDGANNRFSQSRKALKKADLLWDGLGHSSAK
jgi:hypothetical protein